MTWLDDLEERLMRAGARGISQQLAEQVTRAFGGRDEGDSSHRHDDVWDTATHEDPRAAAEPPECAWCPLCRAIRLSRQSGPGLAGHVSGAADTLASAAQDALAVLDEILSRSAERRDGPPPGPPDVPEPPRPPEGPEVPGAPGPAGGPAPGPPGPAGPGPAGPGPAGPGAPGPAGGPAATTDGPAAPAPGLGGGPAPAGGPEPGPAAADGQEPGPGGGTGERRPHSGPPERPGDGPAGPA